MDISGIKKIGAVLLISGILSLIFGAVFISEAISKSNLITEAMSSERVKYGSADGTIDGIIDTPAEAAVMVSVLKEHRTTRYGYYSELERDDPNRAKILNAITMETSLNLAQLGHGLTDVVKFTGLFMGLMGATLVVSGTLAIRSKV